MRNLKLLTHHQKQSRFMLLNFEVINEDTILAGSPINAKGEVANDETAIGILLEDVTRDYPLGEVVIGGFIDFEAAQNACDLTYTPAMMTALNNISFVGVGDKWVGGGSGNAGNAGGEVDWEDIKNKPFYEKETQEILYQNTPSWEYEEESFEIPHYVATVSFDKETSFVVGDTYILDSSEFIEDGDYNATEPISIVCTDATYLEFSFRTEDDQDCYVKFSCEGTEVVTINSKLFSYDVKLTHIGKEVKKLDANFAPVVSFAAVLDEDAYTVYVRGAGMGEIYKALEAHDPVCGVFYNSNGEMFPFEKLWIEQLDFDGYTRQYIHGTVSDPTLPADSYILMYVWRESAELVDPNAG